MGAIFSAPVQTGPGAHPAFCTLGTGSSLGVKQPRRGTDCPLPTSTEVNEIVGLYIYAHLGLLACSRVNCTFTFITLYSTDFLCYVLVSKMENFKA